MAAAFRGGITSDSHQIESSLLTYDVNRTTSPELTTWCDAVLTPRDERAM